MNTEIEMPGNLPVDRSPEIRFGDPMHTLMTISEAASKLHSEVPVSTLHRARRQGKLWSTKIGKRFYTTEYALEEFIKWQGNVSQHGSTSEKMKSGGLYEMATSTSGQAMALASVNRLKKLSRVT